MASDERGSRSPVLDAHNNNQECGLTDGVRLVPPRSILSWLIDEKKVLNRAKIYCAGKDRATIIKTGQVSHAGIECDCCQRLYSITEFNDHAKGSGDNPYANLFREPDCTRNLTNILRELICKSHRGLFKGENDSVCSVCHIGGKTHELTSCSGCSYSFHRKCLNLQGDAPAGCWYCPFCCCSACDMSQVPNDNMIYCHQCEHYYHEGCRENGEIICSLKSCATVTSLNGIGTIPKERWFCSKSCAKIYNGLQNHIGKRNRTIKDGFTWTLIKPIEYDWKVQEKKDSHIDSWAVTYSKIFVALRLLQSSIKQIKQLWPGRDLVTDAVLSRGSELKHLNFSGTYTVLLEQKDELISAAVIRVFGEKVAEVLLVATRSVFQEEKNCRTLLKAIEKAM